MPVQFIPMQQQPGPLEGLSVGSNVGAHIVDTYQQARAAAVEHELAKVRLQHAAQMAPLEELQARNNIDLAPLIAQSHTDLARAAMMRAGVDPHTAKVLSPEAAKLMDARAQNQMAQADYHTKAAAMYDQLHSGKGATTRPMSDASMTTGDWVDSMIGKLPQSAWDDPAVLHAFVQLEIARNPKRYNPNGLGAPPELEQNIVDSLMFAHRARMGPPAPDNMASFAQHYQNMRNAAQPPATQAAAPEPAPAMSRLGSFASGAGAGIAGAVGAGGMGSAGADAMGAAGVGSTLASAMAGQSSEPPTVTSAEELAAIPTGTTFIYKGQPKIKQ